MTRSEIEQTIKEIKGKIEMRIGQTVDVHREVSKEGIRLSASTLRDHKHYQSNHIMAPENWSSEFYIDTAVVTLAELLRDSFIHETNRPRVYHPRENY